MNLDEIDCRLLAALQENANLTASQLSETLHLSASQAGRRRQRLEADGYIVGYKAQLNPALLGLSIQAFIQVQMAAHTIEGADNFQRLLAYQPEVISAWTLTGEADYMLRVICQDLKALDRLLREVLLPHTAVARVQSQIVMNECKADAPLPTGGMI